ncbi:hypothetical protein C6P45_001016 [Maudiozyma exigua]|uniref:Arrestin C-terminal-like domain-containing protein n=1 Tax=Maudiozyma exigua TaxID=34358 RepID=A0A9P7BB41_MAUEX|nr:hypothetical protein C6P45_001016 [Kazachstania exigua]
MLSSGSKSPDKSPILFDIRIRNTDNTDNVLIIKGSPEHASSVLLSGVVVLSVSQPIQIKNLRLYLTGRLLLNLPATANNPNAPLQRFVKFDKLFFKHNWDDFNIETYFDNLYDNYGTTRTINSKSSTNIAGMQKKRLRSKSNSSILSLGGYSNSNNSYRTLMQGNYEFPFSAILPGSMTESVEGLKNAAVVYKLQATVERPKLADLTCTKHLRVIRTLSSDAVELSESTTIDNSWPKKVEYSISIPVKAIAIGSSTPIDMSFVPILKGLKLGPVKVYLIETVQCSAGHRGNFSEEKILTKLKIKDPIGHVKLRKTRQQKIDSGELSPDDIMEDEIFQDRWNFETVLNIPSNLTRCNQDASILSNIKLRHKLKFVVSLINPDGHISELRASLPLQLFISPFVAVTCKSPESIERNIKNFGKPVPTNPNHEDKGIGSTRESVASVSSGSSGGDNDSENVLFAKNYSEVQLQAGALQNNVVAPLLVSNLMTPPNYGNHVYDRLYGTTQGDASGNITPRSISPVGNSSPLPRVGSLPNNVIHMTQFEPTTPQLNGSRTSSNRSSRRGSPSHDVFNFESPVAVPALSSVNLAGIGLQISPAPTPTPTSIDFVSGQTTFHSDAYPPSPSVASDWELNSLSRVPSYTKAMNSDISGADLPPSYPAGSEPTSNRLSLERPQNARQRSSSSLAVPSGRLRSSSVMSKSSNGSNTSLHAMTGNDCHLRVSSMDTSHAVKNTANKVFSFNMTPVQSEQITFNNKDAPVDNEDPDSPYVQQAQSFTISRSRNSSFNKKTSSFTNFFDLFSKKEPSTY